MACFVFEAFYPFVLSLFVHICNVGTIVIVAVNAIRYIRKQFIVD